MILFDLYNNSLIDLINLANQETGISNWKEMYSNSSIILDYLNTFSLKYYDKYFLNLEKSYDLVKNQTKLININVNLYKNNTLNQSVIMDSNLVNLKNARIKNPLNPEVFSDLTNKNYVDSINYDLRNYSETNINKHNEEIELLKLKLNSVSSNLDRLFRFFVNDEQNLILDR